MKNKNATGMIVAPHPADIISSQLKLDRNTFVQAVALYNSLTQLGQPQFGQPGQVIVPNEGTDENTGKRGRGRPKGSKNKPGHKAGRPKAAKRGRPAKAKAAKRGRPAKAKAAKRGRPAAKRGPGRPKGSTNKTASVKRKTVKGGAKRGRKPKNASGVSLRDAVANVVRNASGNIGAADIVTALNKQGFTSKSLYTQVNQELSRMKKDGIVSRPERGQYAWSGSPTPVDVVTTPTDAEQHA